MNSEMFDDVIVVQNDIDAASDFVGVVEVGGEVLEVFAPREELNEAFYAPFEFYDVADYVGGE